MSLPADGWKNKKGTAERSCKCGSWKQHWINYLQEKWPSKCSVYGCNNPATLGAHIINSNVTSEYIAPMCDSCNKRNTEFRLKGDTLLAPANKQSTCEK